MKKKEEKIGYYKKKDLKLTEGFNSFDILNGKQLHFGPRSKVEEDNDAVQVVAGAILVVNNEKIFVISKSEKSTGKGSPETGKDLIYVGGHLSEIDSEKNDAVEKLMNLKLANVSEVQKIFFRGVCRELSEPDETNFDLTKCNIITSIKPSGLYYTPSAGVKSSKHMLAAYIVNFSEEPDISFEG